MSNSINLDSFRQLIKHDDGRDKAGESSSFFAYKIDENNGLCTHLGFKQNQISKADYFLIDKTNNVAQIIELSDLSNTIQECKSAQLVFEEDGKGAESFVGILNKSKAGAKKVIDKRIWSELTAEFKNKWMGSIAILERYCRKDEHFEDLEYKMLIVLTSKTDLKELQIVCDNLRGMLGKVPVCHPHTIGELLIEHLSEES